MNRSKPPVIASWLLEHLTRRTRNQALAGDLTEEFLHGRSAAWYRRQVLLAIITSLLEALRSASFALSFGLLWTFATILFWGRVFFPTYIHMARQAAPMWYARLNWPWSMAVEITFLSVLTTLPVTTGLLVFLFVWRRFSLAGFLRGAELVFIFQAARELIITVISVDKLLNSAMLFGILVLSMWAARNSKHRPAASIVK